jgi:peptide/nickel transport system ATP-binding protein
MAELELRDVSVSFGHGANAMLAVDRVSLTVPPGGVLGLVGESGSGKSSLARAIVGLNPLSGGQILLGGRPLDAGTGRKSRLRRRRIQMVFQDPYGSLNPRMTAGQAISEALTTTRSTSRGRRHASVDELLELVSLNPRLATAFPRQMSGGQRQRVAIARTLAAEPEVLIADEITSALDVSVQGAILNLIHDLRIRLNLSVLFISHNLSVVRYVSDSIAVMYLGRVVESAGVQELTGSPQHPYTRTLLDAVPSVHAARASAAALLDGDPPDPRNPPPGCAFHPRCPIGPVANPDRRVCLTDDPRSEAHDRRHRAACHFAPAASAPANSAVPVDLAAPLIGHNSVARHADR